MKVLALFYFLNVFTTGHQTLNESGFDTSINFSGENIPIENDKVKILYFKELRNLEINNKCEKAFKNKAPKYFPIASAILYHFRIPDDFKFLLFAESFLENDISSKGAVGYWQIMDQTLQNYGLVIDSYNDPRKSFIKSTNIACWYISSLYKVFGSWTLAAAAYNEGPGRLKRQIIKQNCKNYYFLNLNSETGKYLYKILALKYIYQSDNKNSY